MKIKIIEAYDTVEVDQEFDIEGMYARDLIKSGHAVAIDADGNVIETKPEDSDENPETPAKGGKPNNKTKGDK
ncbi:hypothetical protein [Pedobacter duraquae]|uniref:Uncharacterized protein n=1 Tax=Pedobacter duraquae TaxID=425511 RepID=A0A4R6IIT4_9SPHI|nr:hypothetical protein [Pedobacter duraquae]TDO21894.1 hypothetical protein CLV32_3002 [Pedobacter duraquae]